MRDSFGLFDLETLTDFALKFSIEWMGGPGKKGPSADGPSTQHASNLSRDLKNGQQVFTMS